MGCVEQKRNQPFHGHAGKPQRVLVAFPVPFPRCFPRLLRKKVRKHLSSPVKLSFSVLQRLVDLVLRLCPKLGVLPNNFISFGQGFVEASLQVMGRGGLLLKPSGELLDFRLPLLVIHGLSMCSKWRRTIPAGKVLVNWPAGLSSSRGFG